MSDDAFVRVVLEDAPPEQRLGAITLSEAAAANREACLQVALAALDDAHDELGTSDAQRALDRAKVRTFITEICTASIEKIRLRMAHGYGVQ